MWCDVMECDEVCCDMIHVVTACDVTWCNATHWISNVDICPMLEQNFNCFQMVPCCEDQGTPTVLRNGAQEKRREENRAEYRIVIWCRYKEELQADRQSGWPENEEEISKRWNRSGTAKKKYSEGEVQRSLRKSNHGGTVSLCCSVGTHAVGWIDVCSVFYEQLKRCYPPVLRCLHHSRVTVLRWCTNHTHTHTHTHGRPYRQTDRQQLMWVV